MNVKLLAEICKEPGAPGFEGRIRDLIIKELDGLVDSIDIDNMGNVIAVKKGRSSKKSIMSAAHIDEIGFMVRHIDANGFIRFLPIGGFDAKTLTAQRVIIHGKRDIIGVMGCKPIHIMTPAEKAKLPEVTDFFIDTGLTKAELAEIIEVGNPITRERELIEMGHCVNVKSLDNRVSAFILVETLRRLKEEKRRPAYDFIAAFTVQEEVGIRGAQVSALAAKPDFAIALDVTLACDLPGSPDHEKISELGKGTAIKLLDSSVICDARMVAYLKGLATKHGITWQTEMLPAGGTDTAMLQRMVPGGSIAGALSIPTRYIHQVIEMCHKDDIQATIDLLTEAVVELDDYTWAHSNPLKPTSKPTTISRDAKVSKATKSAKATKGSEDKKKAKKK